LIGTCPISCTTASGTCSDYCLGDYDSFFDMRDPREFVAAPAVAQEFIRGIEIRQTTSTLTETFVRVSLFAISAPAFNATLNVTLNTDSYCIRNPVMFAVSGTCYCPSEVLDTTICIAVYWDGPLFWGLRTGDWTYAGLATYAIGVAWAVLLGIVAVALGAFAFAAYMLWQTIKRMRLNRNLAQFLDSYGQEKEDKLLLALKQRPAGIGAQFEAAMAEQAASTTESDLASMRFWGPVVLGASAIAAIMMGIGASSSFWSILIAACFVLTAVSATYSAKGSNQVTLSGITLFASSAILVGLGCFFWLGQKSTFMLAGDAWAWIGWAAGVLLVVSAGPAFIVSSVFIFTDLQRRRAYGNVTADTESPSPPDVSRLSS